MATRLFEAAGLDAQKDIRREVLATGVSNARLQDGSLDAYFLVGGLPLPGVVNLAAKGVRFRLVDQGATALLAFSSGMMRVKLHAQNQRQGRALHPALREWAYPRPYPTSAERAQELQPWIHAYNWHRPLGRRRCSWRQRRVPPRLDLARRLGARADHGGPMSAHLR